MAERVPILAANWKMHKTAGEAIDFMDAFLPRVERSGPEVVICPPYTALAAVVESCTVGTVRVAAQNMHQDESGAFTGEISAPMLVDIGVHGVILGHSERRQMFGETDDALAKKVPVALDAGLEPILCCGESESQRDADETAEVLTRQIDTDLAGVANDRLAEVVIAYEPIWAIGTGRTATAEQAQEAVALIRERVAARDAGAAEQVRILYGGSVKPDNAEELIGQPDVDGALVGGASLDADDFAAIVEAASK
jgi:triosephosphate isomerase (TIM)